MLLSLVIAELHLTSRLVMREQLSSHISLLLSTCSHHVFVQTGAISIPNIEVFTIE